MTKPPTGNVLGLLARFDSPAALVAAAEKVRDAGYKKFDCHSPFPIHSMDAAMGLKRSPLGWIVGLAAVVGASSGLGLQWFASTIDYPLVISGKPFFSFQAYVPVTFGIGVLLAAITALAGMLALNGLPRPFHPVFYAEQFSTASDDGFFVSIEADDPLFDKERTAQFLISIGGGNVEALCRD